MVDTIIGDRCEDVIGFVHRVKQTKRKSESVFLHQMRQQKLFKYALHGSCLIFHLSRQESSGLKKKALRASNKAS